MTGIHQTNSNKIPNLNRFFSAPSKILLNRVSHFWITIVLLVERWKKAHSGSNGTVTLFFCYAFLWNVLNSPQPSTINHQFNVDRWEKFCWCSQKKNQQEIVNVDEYVIRVLHHNSLCHFCYRDKKKEWKKNQQKLERK